MVVWLLMIYIFKIILVIGNTVYYHRFLQVTLETLVLEYKIGLQYLEQ